MFWVAIAIIVILWLTEVWRAAAFKRSLRCKHGVNSDCPECLFEAQKQAQLAAKAAAEAEARRKEELDRAYFDIDEATRAEIISVLEEHWEHAALLDWTADQMKQAVLKVYWQRQENAGRPIEVSGASIKKPMR